MDAILFWIFAAVAVAASLLVIGQRNAMYSALLLIVSFAALSGLYVLLNAPFVAVIQIVVYAGAIMVLFLFVVMLLNAAVEDRPDRAALRFMGHAGPRRFGAVLSLGLVVELAWAVRRLPAGPLAPSDQPTSVAAIGVKLFHDYAFAFEATSILILVAMVGAVILARKEPHDRRAS